ncbi:MAG: radical SAM protein [Dehalococcoidales bacterium]|nr:radical SAM protein [Dehalococcoidales bacterium]
MTVIGIDKKGREVTKGTKEWADFNVNCVKGCSNDCKYCYAKMMAKRFGRSTDEEWKHMTINKSAVEKKYRKYNGRVMFPSTHDITDNEEVIEACLMVIEKLLNAGNEVLITTKPKLSVTKRIIFTFSEYIDQLQFRFTITSMNNNLLSFWEPKAPSYEERFASLKYAFSHGLKTSVSIEPFLDYLPQKLVYTLTPYVTESIWLGPMNYITRNGLSTDEENMYDEIRMKYEYKHLLDIYNELIDFPLIRFKDSMLNRLNIEIKKEYF